MLNYFKNFFASGRSAAQNTSALDDGVALAEMQRLFPMLYQEIECHRTTAIDSELFNQIITLMQRIKHYPPAKMQTWRRLGHSYFGTHYITELKDTPRTFRYGDQITAGALSVLVGARPQLPFCTTEIILAEIQCGLTINTLEHYQRLLELCEFYDATTMKLLCLNEAEKMQFIAVLQSVGYPMKFEHALAKYIEHDLKDAQSFSYLTKHILTFTAVDFMLKANDCMLPSREILSAPIPIPAYLGSPLLFSAKARPSVDDAEEIFEFEPDERHRKRTHIAAGSPGAT